METKPNGKLSSIFITILATAFISFGISWFVGYGRQQEKQDSIERTLFSHLKFSEAKSKEFDAVERTQAVMMEKISQMATDIREIKEDLKKRK